MAAEKRDPTRDATLGLTDSWPSMTLRQRVILDFVRIFLADRGRPPRVGEIADCVGVADVAVVREDLTQMQERGWVRRVPPVAQDADRPQPELCRRPAQMCARHQAVTDAARELVAAFDLPKGRGSAKGRAAERWLRAALAQLDDSMGVSHG